MTISSNTNLFIAIITGSGLIFGFLILREVLKYFRIIKPRHYDLKYSETSFNDLKKISQTPFLFGLEKKLISNLDFYFDDQYLYAANENNETAKFPLDNVTEISRTSIRINNSQIWQVKIKDDLEEKVFKFTHNFSLRNQNFVDFYDKIKVINPTAIKSKWNLWRM